MVLMAQMKGSAPGSHISQLRCKPTVACPGIKDKIYTHAFQHPLSLCSK